MIIRNTDLHQQTVIAPQHGAGEMEKTVLVPADVNRHIKRFVHLTLKPGCVLGMHLHKDDSEYYYILSGHGIYDDNGTASPVSAGDLCLVLPGESHSLTNDGGADLVVMALILPD